MESKIEESCLCEQEDTVVDEQEQRRQKKKLLVQVCALFTGAFFSFASFKAVLSLQSTINIEDSIGAMSGTVIYLTAMIFCAFFTPTVLKIIGAKTGLIISEIGYCIFIMGNFYPVAPIMLFGSFVGGVAEAIIWPSLSILCVSIAVRQSNISGHSKDIYIAKLFGQFYSVVFGTMFLGNTISYGFLMIFHVENHQNYTQEVHIGQNHSVKCGSYDCQREVEIEDNISNYVPGKRSTVYILLSVFVAMGLSSTIIHYKFIQVQKEQGNHHDEKKRQNDDKVRGYWTEILSTFTGTLKQVTNLVQVLIIPIYLYAGIKMGFMISEFTRAYVACIVGVEHVGLSVGIFGIAGCFTSLIAQKISTSQSKSIVIACCLLVDMCFFLLILITEINDSSEWFLQLMSLTQGFTDGFFLPITNKMCTEYFSSDRNEVAFSLWNICIVGGVMCEFAFTRFACMGTKIYAHIAFIALTGICYAMAEFVHHRKHPQQQSI